MTKRALKILLVAAIIIILVFIIYSMVWLDSKGNVAGFSYLKIAVPYYPDAMDWNVDASNGFPGSDPSEVVVFNTYDSGEKVINFYKEKLIKSGWVVKDMVITDARVPISEKGITSIHHNRGYSVFFSRNLFGLTLGLHIIKTDQIDIDGVPYNKKEQNRVTITM